MAQGSCEDRAFVGAARPERLVWVLSRLMAMLLWFVVATALSLLAHIGMYVEGGGGWIEVTSGAFIGDVQAKKKADAGSNGGGQPQSNGPDKVEQEAPGSGKSIETGSDEPPKTVAEAIGNLVKWMQPKPQPVPPWSEVEVTRASEKGSSVGQLAQKGRGAKKSANTPESNAAQSIAALPLPGTYKPNELLVFGASSSVLRELVLRGWRQTAGAGNGVVRLVSDTQDPVVARKQLQSEIQGANFGLNFIYHLADDGTPPRSANSASGLGSCDPQRCYAAPLIKWRAGLAACAAGITIGIIDTAVDTAHPALAWKKLQVRRKSDASEPHSHGTGVVSLLTGDPNSDTAGLLPDADYVIADAFYKNGSGKLETDTVHLLWALSVLDQHGAQVVNMSLSGPRDPLVHQRLSELTLKGMIFVAAAGNGGPDAPSAYPAAYEEEVIAVTAVDRNKRVYDQANRGRYIDVAAPGVRIWTALPNSKAGVQSGTSFAAPFITAIVASIYKHALLPASSDASRPRIPEAVTLAHLSTKNNIRDDAVGLGLVTAPSSCAAGGGHKAPPGLPTATLKRWETRVDFASTRAAN